METTNVRRRLTRLPAEGRLAGVCAGLAAYLDIDVTLVRLAWIILSIIPGAIVGGLIVYVVAWLIMPEGVSVPGAVPRGRLARSVNDRKIAGVCGGLAKYFDEDPSLVRLAVVILSIYPGAIVFGVLAYAVAWLVMPEELAMPPVPPVPPISVSVDDRLPAD